MRDFSGAGWWPHGDNTYLAEQCGTMTVRREGSCWCPRSLASWAEDGRRVDDREKPQPSKGPVKVPHVHEDAMILEELFRNGSFQDSSQAPYDSWGPHTRVTSVASYRRGPVSQTRPQNLVLAPTCTCGDTDRQESGMARAQRSQRWGHFHSSGKSLHALTRSQQAPAGCHLGPGLHAVLPLSP